MSVVSYCVALKKSQLERFSQRSLNTEHDKRESASFFLLSRITFAENKRE